MIHPIMMKMNLDLFLGIETALEAIAQWKRNRKIAILSLAAAVIVLGICAVTYFL